MKCKPKYTKRIQYRNLKYCFAISFPRWWKPYTVVDRKARFGNTKESFLSFRFRYKDKVYDPIFTLDISTLTGKAWRRYFEGSPVIFLGEYKGLTFGYLLPEELPDAFLRPDKEDYDYVKFGRQIRILKKLVAEAPEVLKSFRFIKNCKFASLCGVPFHAAQKSGLQKKGGFTSGKSTLYLRPNRKL